MSIPWRKEGTYLPDRIKNLRHNIGFKRQDDDQHEKDSRHMEYREDCFHCVMNVIACPL